FTLTVSVKSGVPEQVASAGLNRPNVIVPPALLVAPLIVAESLGSRFWAVVAFGLFFPMTSFSDVQSLVAPSLLASPEYTACQKNDPAELNWTPLESGTTPLVTVLVPPSAKDVEQALSV